MTDKQNLIYLAGFVDGEGHFCRPNCKNGRGESYLQSRMIVTQVNEEVIRWIEKNYGGYVQYVIRKAKDLPRKNYYNWILSGKKCEELARKLQPYLIVKREQVKRVLEY